MIDQILTNEYFLLALTFGIYQGAKMLQRRTGSILLNPILIAIGLMIAFLTACDIPYDTYHKSGQMIEFWLKPAVVALGVPLYLQLSQVKKQILPIHTHLNPLIRYYLTMVNNVLLVATLEELHSQVGFV